MLLPVIETCRKESSSNRTDKYPRPSKIKDRVDITIEQMTCDQGRYDGKIVAPKPLANPTAVPRIGAGNASEAQAYRVALKERLEKVFHGVDADAASLCIELS